MDKKAQIMQNIGALGIAIAGLTIALVVTFLILAQSKTNLNSMDQACENSSFFYTSANDTCCLSGATTCAGVNGSGLSLAFNATRELTNATATIPSWVPLIVIVVIGSVLVGLVSLFRR